jgi:FdhD protein
MRGKRFTCLSGEERLLRDIDPESVPEEDRKSRRKSAE